MSVFSPKLFQSPELRQEMKINPRLYHAMELLYLPLLDLQQHLKAELEENPFLEMTEAEAKARAVSTGRIFERMWDYLTFGDPEG